MMDAQMRRSEVRALKVWDTIRACDSAKSYATSTAANSMCDHSATAERTSMETSATRVATATKPSATGGSSISTAAVASCPSGVS